MLTDSRLDAILEALPNMTIGVVGDLFLDRYFDIDPALDEPSLETGLTAYQVTRVRSIPGAAGTVINNLVALGVGRIFPISVIGDDGEGYELRQVLEKQQAIFFDGLRADASRRTPTYMKPMFTSESQLPREGNRLDIKNRDKLSPASETWVMEILETVFPQLDALLVLDQVSEPDCGVITAPVREVLSRLGQRFPEKWVLADSRERIGAFRNMVVKPNRRECEAAVPDAGPWPAALLELVKRVGRPAFCTCGEDGMLIAQPGEAKILEIPAVKVTGPIDTVGAGDSTSAALACALGTGASLIEAAELGNLVASITIQQIGVTGTASPKALRKRLGLSETRP